MDAIAVIVKDAGPAVACVVVVLYTYLRFVNRVLQGDGNGQKGLSQIHTELLELRGEVRAGFRELPCRNGALPCQGGEGGQNATAGQ